MVAGSDFPATKQHIIAEIPGLVRAENVSREEVLGRLADETHAVYTHEHQYGTYCTLEEYVDCPPEVVFGYLRDTTNLAEWTYSTRGFEKTDQPGLWRGEDTLGDNTVIYARTVSNPEAMTVDFHCAWDQGDELWMVYLMRVVPAALVLGTSGSVVTWTNCRHANYAANPYPELSPAGRAGWVGDLWDLFYAGHKLELTNLKRILEYRHANGIEIIGEAR